MFGLSRPGVFGTPQVFRVLLLALFLPAVLLASTAPAMAQAASASVSGTITDSQGGVLPGVTLTVTNAESGTVRTSVTEADGKFRVGGLNPGRYNITTDLPGFQMVEVKDVTLQVGQDYIRDFQLALSTLQESVTVTGEAPIIEASKSSVSTVITTEQIETLPMQDRTALSLSLLLPGVSVDTTRAKRNATNVGAGVTTSATTYLSAVLTQTLIPVTSGALMPAAELLLVSYGARQHIRKNALQHLHQEITITRKTGSFTFEESLAKLVEQGVMDRNEARLRAPLYRPLFHLRAPAPGRIVQGLWRDHGISGKTNTHE